jgi:putative ABC transport system substrate-binding protein
VSGGNDSLYCFNFLTQRLIYDLANPTVAAYLRALEAAAPSFGVQVFGTAVHDAEGIERAIAVFGAEPNGGPIVPSGPATVNHLERLIALATAKALPSVHPTREAVLAGALASYGVDTRELFRSAAFYVDRILKGEQPGDLPIQFATKFELVINLKTAKALGLDPPIQLLARTDEVIE